MLYPSSKSVEIKRDTSGKSKKRFSVIACCKNLERLKNLLVVEKQKLHSLNRSWKSSPNPCTFFREILREIQGAVSGERAGEALNFSLSPENLTLLSARTSTRARNFESPAGLVKAPGRVRIVPLLFLCLLFFCFFFYAKFSIFQKR